MLKSAATGHALGIEQSSGIRSAEIAAMAGHAAGHQLAACRVRSPGWTLNCWGHCSSDGTRSVAHGTSECDHGGLPVRLRARVIKLVRIPELAIGRRTYRHAAVVTPPARTCLGTTSAP